MKKCVTIIYCILCLIFFLFSLPIPKLPSAHANDILQTQFYAQALEQDVVFYKDVDKTPLFVLPATYYVMLLEDQNELGLYKAKYKNQIGFVEAIKVQCVQFAPLNPYPQNINFRILASQSAELRSTPSRSEGLSNLICNLSLYETNFDYYGSITGEEVVAKRGTDWHYCAYKENNNLKYGYVYAGLVDQFKTIYRQDIDAYPITKHNWSTLYPSITDTSQNLQINLPNSNQTLIIIAISIPILVLIIALFKPAKTTKTLKGATSNNVNKTSNSYSSNLNSTQNATNKTNGNLITFASTSSKTTIKKAPKGKDFYEL